MRPRIRTLKPEVWADEKIGGLSRDARLLFVGLITMADDEGRLRDLPAAISGHVFPHDGVSPSRVGQWLGEVVRTGMVCRYEVDGGKYLAFRHWTDHQRINRPQKSLFPPPPFTDDSVKDHGKISDRSVEVHSSPRRRADPDPDPVVKAFDVELQKLCLRLAERIRGNDPKASPQPESERWRREMRLLVAERGGTADAVAEVGRIIDWSQSDSFWRSNVLSPSKLRKQFTQLVLKANGSSADSVGSHLPDSHRSTPEHRAQVEAIFGKREEAA